MNREDKKMFLPSLLDVDEGIMEKGLRIVSDAQGDEMSKLFPEFSATERKRTDTNAPLMPEPDWPSVQVSPEPGICVKTANINGGKVFINFCKLSEVPPPLPMTEDRLKEIIANEDYSTDFKIPISLGAPHEEKDKKGEPCFVFDVAVNSVWFSETFYNNITFTTFTVQITMEALCQKYGDVGNLDRQNWVILKNKKFMGQIQRQRIQLRPGYTKIKELDQLMGHQPNLVKIEEIVGASHSTATLPTPEYAMHKSTDKTKLIVKISIPKLGTGRDLLLDVGEDRIVFESKNPPLFLDIFVPLSLDGSQTKAEFCSGTGILTLYIPILK